MLLTHVDCLAVAGNAPCDVANVTLGVESTIDKDDNSDDITGEINRKKLLNRFSISLMCL
jgi:uncharacterized protein YegJ (DUF2314 family)